MPIKLELKCVDSCSRVLSVLTLLVCFTFFLENLQEEGDGGQQQPSLLGLRGQSELE